MLTSFLIAAGFVLLLIILRNYSSAEHHARHLAKAEHFRLNEESPQDSLAKLSEDDFIDYFEWLRRRRFWLYLGVFAGFSVPATFVAMSILSYVKLKSDPGPWLWGFIAVFVLVATWWACAFGALYLHRVRRDPSLARNLKSWPGPDSEDDV